MKSAHAENTPCIIQLTGYSGSGKTTSIVRASTLLKEKGLRVAVIKHTHHDIDVAHKDSWRFLNEGQADYSVVYMGSGEKVALFTRTWTLADLINFLQGRVDVIMIEGFRDLNIGVKIDLNLGDGIEAVVEKIVDIALKCVSR